MWLELTSAWTLIATIDREVAKKGNPITPMKGKGIAYIYILIRTQKIIYPVPRNENIKKYIGTARDDVTSPQYISFPLHKPRDR